MGWKWKPLIFFTLKLPPSPPQLSPQNDSGGGSPWSCSRTPSLRLHPLDPSLPSLSRRFEVISPSEKLLLETNPSICSRTWGVRCISSLPKRYSGRNSWQKCMGFLALSLHLDTFCYTGWCNPSISQQKHVLRYSSFFIDGQTCFSITLQLTLPVCCYYYLCSLRTKPKQSINKEKQTSLLLLFNK